MSSEFEAILISESAQAKRYQSKHHYDLTEMGLTREELGELFKDVIEEYEIPV